LDALHELCDRLQTRGGNAAGRHKGINDGFGFLEGPESCIEGIVCFFVRIDELRSETRLRKVKEGSKEIRGFEGLERDGDLSEMFLEDRQGRHLLINHLLILFRCIVSKLRARLEFEGHGLRLRVRGQGRSGQRDLDDGRNRRVQEFVDVAERRRGGFVKGEKTRFVDSEGNGRGTR